MTIQAIPTPGGGHDIVSDKYQNAGGDGPLVLVRVRPVGTLEWGDLEMFVADWVPELVEALVLAHKLSDPPTHPYTPIVQSEIVAAMNVIGAALLGDTWELILESPVPNDDVDAILSEHIPVPVSQRELQSCQHHRIDNTTACCTVCNEQMVAWTVDAKTVLSAPNLNPCTNPKHLAAIAAGEEVDCENVYVPGPAQTVIVGYEVKYQCARCTTSLQLIEGQAFVADCGHSHLGELIPQQQFSNVLPVGDGQ